MSSSTICNGECISKVKKALTEFHGPASEINFPNLALIRHGTVVRAEIEPLKYTFKDAGGKKKKSQVMLSYCPFCGLPLEEEIANLDNDKST